MSRRVDLTALRKRAGNLTADDLRKAAEALGWEHARTTGSHLEMTKRGARTLAISRHANKRTYLSVIKVLERESSYGRES